MPPVSGRTKVLAVFGCPVEHSLSPAMHNAAIAALHLHYAYIPFSVPPDRLGPAIESVRALGIIGVNLTIPHKERVLALLDEVTADARAVGAVNTVHNADGRLIGHNTDGEGFARPLARVGFRAGGAHAVVLGAGGAARSVVYRLVRDGARVTIANRTAERAERLAREAEKAGGGQPLGWLDLADRRSLVDAVMSADLLVNCTSAGMAPRHEEPSPVPDEVLRPGLLVYDLVYNPMETALLAAAGRAGAGTVSGVPMLACQGAESLRIWLGIEPPVDLMERVVRDSLTARQPNTG